MAAPDRLRIPLEEDQGYWWMGRLRDGVQFWAFVTGAWPTAEKYSSGPDARHKKRWLAVLHRFDADGSHLGTEARLGGFDIEGRDVAGDKAASQLEKMYREMVARHGGGEPELCDIWVKPFAVEIDGVTHGLIYEHHPAGEEDPEDEEYDYVMLEPRDIMFHPPWDSGQYST